MLFGGVEEGCTVRHLECAVLLIDDAEDVKRVAAVKVRFSGVEELIRYCCEGCHDS